MEQLQPNSDALQAIEAAMRDGRQDEARVLAAALRLESPAAAEAWIWSARLAETPEESLRYAQEAARLAPGAKTKALVRWARHRSISPDQTAIEGRDSTGLADGPESAPLAYSSPEAGARLPARLLDPILLLSTVILLALGAWLVMGRAATAESRARPIPTPNPALHLSREAGQLWANGERAAALDRWQAAHDLRPDIPDITESLTRAHVAVASELLRNREPAAALPHLEAAYSLMPEETVVAREYQALVAYEAGRSSVEKRDWDSALSALSPLHALDPEYLDVGELVEQALAGQRQVEAERRAARDLSLSRALQVGAGAQLRASLIPPTLSNEPGQTRMPAEGLLGRGSDKHIVVSINAQRMYVYENGQLIWDWVASTGEPGRPTIPGRYRIQSKFENARSNVWSLWMPYWQGIYWAGSVENGIHGQVTFDSGGRLWEGYLGTRITFGCVMISDEHAGMLFNWTEMGTPVSIHWDWDPSWKPDANGDPLQTGS